MLLQMVNYLPLRFSMIESMAWEKTFWSGDGSVEIGVELEGNGRGSLMALS